MTTFQDPPPQSRRAVRQSERAENPDAAETYSFDAASPEAVAETARAESHAAGHRAEGASHVAPPSSVDPSNAESVNAEPLNYMTQGRLHQGPVIGSQSAPPSPADQGTFRVRDYSPEGRRAAISREQFSGVTSTPAAPPVSRPLAPQPPAPPSQVDLDYFTQGAPAVHQQTPSAPPVGAPAATAPTVPAAPNAAAVPSTREPSIETGAFDHTVTRRELRALREAQERRAESQGRPETIDNILNSGPIVIPVLSVQPGQSKALEDAMAEFDQLSRNRPDLEVPAPATPVAQAAPIVETPPVAEATPAPQAEPAPPASAAQPFPFRLTAPSAAEPPVEAAFVPPPLVEPQPLPTGPLEAALQEPQLVSLADIAPGLAPEAVETVEPERVELAPAQQPFVAAPTPAPAPAPPVSEAPGAALAPPTFEQAPTVVPQAPIVPPTRSEAPSGSADPVFLEPDRAGSKPVGHWSVQAELDDDDLGRENTVSRTVGAGTAAITTSALVLPSVPEMGDLLHPFTSTGEILVTGSIDLPRSLGATGAHPHRVDNSDFEDDPLDSQVVSTDSAPVRAIRAISTHTSTRGVIEQKRRSSSRMPAVMIVVASVLALGVVSLLVVAFATGLFH